MNAWLNVVAVSTTLLVVSCDPITTLGEEEVDGSYPAVEATFNGTIDLNNLADYESQDVPDYINKDNTDDNRITDAGATLGRALFYDNSLSVDQTVSCASCHQQAYAFGDPLQASLGINGTTGRHSMRLVNARFGDEDSFFWDERAPTLEFQTTQPIQDHTEMGYSGEDGNPGFEGLIARLEGLEYYQEMFSYVYGDATITEERMQWALAQFIRSIQSFDSKYDQGRDRVNNDRNPFPNFTTQENDGKDLFLTPPQLNNQGIRVGGGFGCQGCHRAPEFDIDPNSDNNGFIGTLNGGTDLSVTRSPSLRDLFNPQGEINGGLMHTGELTSFEAVMEHYNEIEVGDNNNLDPRLRNRDNGRNLAATDEEVAAITAFIKTLTGSDMYSNEKWSDPFGN